MHLLHHPFFTPMRTENDSVQNRQLMLKSNHSACCWIHIVKPVCWSHCYCCCKSQLVPASAASPQPETAKGHAAKILPCVLTAQLLYSILVSGDCVLLGR